MIVVVHELLLALGVERFTIRINHRQLLSGILESVQLSERAAEILRALDKLGKTGPGCRRRGNAGSGRRHGEAVVDPFAVCVNQREPPRVLAAVVAVD